MSAGTERTEPAPEGDYAFTVAVRDKAGNVTEAPLPEPTAAAARPGTGVSVRDFTLRGPLSAVTAGAFAHLEVGPVDRSFDFVVSRLGDPKPVLRGGRLGGRFRIHVPSKMRTGVYVVRVIGAVETEKLRPMRLPLVVRMRVDDGPSGETSEYVRRVGYCDQFYSVAEIYYPAPGRRAYRAEIDLDPASQVDLLVANVTLDDVLAGAKREAIKSKTTIASAIPAARDALADRKQQDATIPYSWAQSTNRQRRWTSPTTTACSIIAGASMRSIKKGGSRAERCSASVCVTSPSPAPRGTDGMHVEVVAVV